MISLTDKRRSILLFIVVKVIVGTTHGATQYGVNKQRNNILNLTPLGDQNYQLLLAEVFLGRK